MTSYKLNPHQVFEAPAVAALFFHNRYEEGKQGSVELIQRGVRLASNGNLRLSGALEQWNVFPRCGERRLLPDGGLQVACEYAAGPTLSQGHVLRYTVQLAPDGEALRLTVSLEQPLPAELAGQVSFSLELIPDAYHGKGYFVDSAGGVFPHQFDGTMVTAPDGVPVPGVLGQGRRLLLAPEDPAVRLEIDSLQGEIALLDGRAFADNGWFIARSLIPAGASQAAINWRLTPTPAPDWVRPPVICYSQVGYHPGQKKIAAIELDSQITSPQSARLMRLLPDGSARLVKEARLALWGHYLCYAYARFDFSEVTESGLYRLEYESQTTALFPIAADAYQRGVWQPTLETFLPVQMCHVEVRDRCRVWHGACHLDDALQAPLNRAHFDGYAQGNETETPYPPLTHIPHLAAGGWHDAGDYDLAAGSQAQTTHTLALAREVFGLDSDQTTVDQANRRVTLHQPDGIPDVVQQVAHGALNLLSGYRAAGHSFSGIIESNLQQYVHLGDAATMTDNRMTEGPPENSDDRWAFTNRDTGLEYTVAAALAAASRVLRGWEDSLAGECLQWARRIWEIEQTQPAKAAPSAYVPRQPAPQEIVAAVELFVATGEDRYRQRLLALTPVVLENFSFVGWAVARILPQLGNATFESQFRSKVETLAHRLATDAAGNPFGAPYLAETWQQQAPVWGIAWSLLQQADSLYFLHQAYPDLINANLIIAILNYVLGCHPASNASLVSGVGPKSLTAAYGVNRADWAHIPGGVVSGPALIRPNYPELHDPFPFLWQQKEYVISGAANYIFCVLAADKIVARGTLD